MRPSTLVVLLVVAVVAAARPPLARAQTAPELVTGWTVHVTTADGRTEKGVVVDISSGTLNIIIREQLTSIRVAEIRQIDREVHDPVQDGLWKGVFVGAVVGGSVLLATESCYVVKCTGLTSRALAVGAGAASGAIVGAIGGVIADAAHNARVQVYPKPPPRLLKLFPLASPHAVGVGGVIRW